MLFPMYMFLHNNGKTKGILPPSEGERGRDTCRLCGRRGHWARDCRSKSKIEEEFGSQLGLDKETTGAEHVIRIEAEKPDEVLTSNLIILIIELKFE